MKMTEKLIEYSSDELECEAGDDDDDDIEDEEEEEEEEELDNQSLHGLSWKCHVSTNNCVFANPTRTDILTFTFQWDDVEIDGFNGKIIVFEENASGNMIPSCANVYITKFVNTLKTTLCQRGKLKYQIHLEPVRNEIVAMEQKFTSSEFTDVVLMVDGKKLHANKGFLSTHSEYFHKMFYSEFKEKTLVEISIEDVKYDHFLRLLTAVHPNSPTPPTDEFVERLLKLADRFLMSEVTKNIEHHLLEHSEISSSKKLLFADKYRLMKLMERVLDELVTKEQIKLINASVEFAAISNAVKADLLRIVMTMI